MNNSIHKQIVYQDNHVTYYDSYCKFVYDLKSQSHLIINEIKDYDKLNDDIRVLIININHPVPNYLFKVKHLMFGEYFNTSINNIYENDCITHLIFGNAFNLKIKKFPKNLFFLQFGIYYDFNVSNLPNNLTHLVFGMYFNKPLNELPSSIKFIKFGYFFNQYIDNTILPPNLETLHLNSYFNKELINLPLNLKNLRLGWDFNQSIHMCPTELLFLELGNDFNQEIHHFPLKLKHLVLGKKFNHSLDNLPDSLETLILDKYGEFNKELHNLPVNNLKYIQFNYIYSKTISVLPTCVNEIKVNKIHNKEIKFLVHKNLKILFYTDF